MSYQFLTDDALADGLREIARQQLRRLERLLRDQDEIATGYHKTRKSIKRLRALLLLAQPIIGSRSWKRLDRSLREVSRALSGQRDSTVIRLVLERLASTYGEAAIGAGGQRLRQTLMEPVLASRSTAEPSPDIARLRRKVVRIARRIEQLPLAGLAVAAALSGMSDAYRAGRAAIRQAYASHHPEDFHDLRKAVQQHMRHMQLFAAAWPQELQLRIELARSLSRRLGEDHDLALLRAALRNGHAANAADGLDRLCQERQLALRSAARGDLKRLYGERPKALGRRMAAYWTAAAAVGLGAQTVGDASSAAGSPAKVKPSSRQERSSRRAVAPAAAHE